MAQQKPTGAEFVTVVTSHLGAPYEYGAAGPRAFDCSGLIQYSLHEMGIYCPRTSEEQWAWVQQVSEPGTGDLVFFVGAELDPPPGHVGVVVNPGRMIDAPFTGAVVRYDAFSEGGTGVNKFIGYGRVPGLSGSASANASVEPSTKGKPSNADFAAIASSVLVVVVLVLLAAVVLTALAVGATFR